MQRSQNTNEPLQRIKFKCAFTDTILPVPFHQSAILRLCRSVPFNLKKDLYLCRALRLGGIAQPMKPHGNPYLKRSGFLLSDHRSTASSGSAF